MSGIHSLFGMSKAPIFVNCTGALALTAAAKLPPETPTIHAASGTCTHSLAERYANGADIDVLRGTKETHDGHEIKIDEDRIERAKLYVDTIRARPGVKQWEVKLSTTPVINVPDQWSTGDCVNAVLDSLTLEVHDLKDGNGLVTAENNEQLIGYLLAAMHQIESEYFVEFQSFYGAIHQPKINWHSEHTYTRAELLAWQEKFRHSVSRSQEVMGLSQNKIYAALNPGDWCEKGWCPMRGNCPARTQKIVDSFPDVTQKALSMTDDELGRILQRKAEIMKAFASWEAEAFTRAKQGGHIPGFKLVDGRKGPRKWEGDEEKISEILYEAIEADTWERSLISPTTAQKKLKKHPDAWKALQLFIVRAPGQLSLVPDVDQRAPVPLDAPEFAVVDNASDLL